MFIPPTPYTHKLTTNELELPWLTTVFICDYPVAKRGVWHTHPDIELVCRMRGELRYDIADGPMITVPPGHAIVIPPQCRHRLSEEIDAPGMRICFLIRSGRCRFPKNAIVNSRVFGSFRAKLLEKSLQPFLMPAFLSQRLQQFARLTAEFKSKARFEDLAMLRLIATDAFLMLADCTAAERSSPSHVIDQVKSFLETKIREKVSISDLVKYSGYGQTQLFRLFSRETGLTPIDWITKRRIEHADTLLRKTTSSVSEIAAAVGFTDTSYFCRVFKKHIGMSPMARRKLPQCRLSASGRQTLPNGR